jgi:hypothetical protein
MVRPSKETLMKNLIRALAKLPRPRLRLLIRAGRMEAKVQLLESRLSAIRKLKANLESRAARIERKLEDAGRSLSGLLQGVGTPRRGPGRPPGKRGPGRPPKRRGPGRPPGSGRRGRTPRNEKPLAQVLKDLLSANKNEPMSVGDLAAQARAAGYKTKSKPDVFAITVSLALRKNTAVFSRTGKKYQLTNSAESSS